ncbi:MAG: hypothetical protein Q9213_003891 [Squamulea squamosa]
MAALSPIGTMAQVISKSSVNPNNSYTHKTKETLMEDLDDLLERYLDLVHRYDSLHQSMAKDLASGYFSLAQANFSNHNRIRFGQDFYDDRMQASTTFYISPSMDETVDDADIERSPQDTIYVTTVQTTSKGPETKQTATDEDSRKPQTERSSISSVSDPLKWFGILVPPTLRASQASFRKVVIETIPVLANLSKEMKSMEIEIRRTRKKIRKLG